MFHFSKTIISKNIIENVKLLIEFRFHGQNWFDGNESVWAFNVHVDDKWGVAFQCFVVIRHLAIMTIV